MRHDGRLSLTVLAIAQLLGCVAVQTRVSPPQQRPDKPVFRPGAPGEPGPMSGTRPIGAATATPALPDTPFNIRVTPDSPNVNQVESPIAIDPAEPLHLVGAAMDWRRTNDRWGIGTYASFDGGLTWQQGMLDEPTYSVQADPSIAFCADGTVVVNLISYHPSVVGMGLFFFRSTDGGRTFPTRRVITNSPGSLPFLDKNWIACDDSNSTYRGRIYAGYLEQTNVLHRLVVKYSTDSGLTWSSARVVSDLTGIASRNGINFGIGPQGQLYAVWFDFESKQIRFDRSTDGGSTWGTDVAIATPAGIPTIGWGGSSLPAIAVDRSGGPFAGTLYVTWTDGPHGDADIWCSYSRNGGTSWSPAVRVNDDPIGSGVNQWLPAVTVDPQGRVAIVFLDRRHDRQTQRIETWGAMSRDGGASFDSNFVISDVAQDGSYDDFLGHYQGVVASTQFIYPLWSDLRSASGSTDLYIDRFPNRFRYDEVTALRFTSKESFTWQAQDSRFGTTMAYDVLSGRLSALRADRGFTASECFAPNVPAGAQSDARTPAPGDGFFYLVRAAGPSGRGSWGDGRPRRRSDERDPLEEATGPCPF